MIFMVIAIIMILIALVGLDQYKQWKQSAVTEVKTGEDGRILSAPDNAWLDRAEDIPSF